MERLWVLILYFSIAFSATVLAIPSDDGFYSRKLKFEIHGHRPSRSSTSESLKKLKLQFQNGFISRPQLKFLTVEPSAVTVNSPFSLPPFDSLAPTPLPVNSPPSPFCEDSPPQTPQSPLSSSSSPPPPPSSGMIYSHAPPSLSPPPSPPSPPSPPGFGPSVPTRSQSPPPSPPSIFPITPIGPLAPYPPANTSSPTPPSGPPSPPHHYGPTPPKHASGPPSHGPSPPVFLPPMVFPPPSGPPPAAHGGKPGSSGPAWCVAKPTVPDPIIQQAMDYACGSGADCKSIQPNEHCYEPDTILAHASYAFNSYWQNTKVRGGTCDFGGTAMIVTVDPSFEGCKFVLS
ncbi:leucine-rich repeat extensin-like protein 3 [Benincasa hispida]|uniref:leucine-rich repeat extensin-like protein 3 n=1 Tax=Benincasa hispida TaxID=102211 RepID=UPI0019019730|nr:leucine-rich repeat extensin-like protein 3 [Benincasa hispida]XP_038897297.1 leucine-rich repeat extensin-like protein 3 [Benincasa hispida]